MPDPISGDAIRRGAQIGSDMAKAQQAPTDKGVKKFDNVMNEKSKEIEATREVLKTDLATQINQVPEAQKVQIQQEWVNRVSKMEHGDQVRYLSKQIEGPQASLASLEKNLPSVPEGPWKNLAMDRLTEIQGEYSRLDSFLKGPAVHGSPCYRS